MPDQNTEPEEQLQEAPLLSHLVELRSRLLKCVVAVLVVFICLAPFSTRIFTLVALPLMAKLPTGATMIATQVAAPLLTPFKTTFFVALVIAMPVVLYQAWAFVAPGLYRREKRFAVPVLFSSIVLFYIGIAFAYFVMFPVMFGFFTAVAPEGVTVMTDINAYLDFVLVIFFSCGLAFEVPVIAVLLIATGLVAPETLTRQRPYVFLGAFVVGMFLTPPDIVSQTMLAIPMYLLYEAGLLMARILMPHRHQRERAEHSAS